MSGGIQGDVLVWMPLLFLALPPEALPPHVTPQLLVLEIEGRRAVPVFGEVSLRTRTTSLVTAAADGSVLVKACAIEGSAAGFAIRGAPDDVARAPTAPASLAAVGEQRTLRLPKLALGEARRPARLFVDVFGIGSWTLRVESRWSAVLVGTAGTDGVVRGDAVVIARDDVRGAPFGEVGPLIVERALFTLSPLPASAGCADADAASVQTR